MSYCLRLTIFMGWIFLLSACSYLGLENHFSNDPLTGGEKAGRSILLDIRLPAGLQRYSSHGFINIDANGGKEGLEIFRGNISASLASVDLFNELRAKDYELRLSLRKEDRSLALYQKKDNLAILTFHRQGLLTILQIWAGSRLPDGAALSFAPAQIPEDDPQVELPGEEYGPLEEHETSEKPGAVERWGSSLQEREL